MTFVPFGEWLPDQPEFLNPGAITATNVTPLTQGSYGPVNALEPVTGALNARCQGAMFTRDAAGDVWGFAGDEKRLYKNVSGSTDWVDITKLAAIQNITAITQAANAQITVTAHARIVGDVVFITGVVGMTQINGLFGTILTVVDVNNFTVNIDSSGFSAYVSGGTIQNELFYSIATDERWSFVQFAERIIATQIADPIQSCIMNVNPVFADLAAAAPKARYVARVRDSFIMVANTDDPIDGAVPQRVWWPALGDPTNWPVPGSVTAAQLQSDFRDLLGDGGANQGIVGGLSGADVAVVQERNIWRGMYIGPPVVFSFAVVESARGTPAPGSIVSVGPVLFYLADDGFYSFDGIQSTPIGHQKVDRTFWNEVDQGFLHRISGAVDPVNKLIYWAYPGPQNSDGTSNRVLIYNYGLGRWSKREGDMIEIMITRALTTGYNLEQLDAFGTLETLAFPLDSRAWTGGRLSLAAFDTAHKMGFFSGAPLAATMDTGEANLNDKGLTQVNRVWPMVDTPDASISVGRRNRLADPVMWVGPSPMTATTGSCPIRATGMYHRARLTVHAGSFWAKAQGVNFDARAAGRR